MTSTESTTGDLATLRDDDDDADNDDGHVVCRCYSCSSCYRALSSPSLSRTVVDATRPQAAAESREGRTTRSVGVVAAADGTSENDKSAERRRRVVEERDYYATMIV